jgi:tetratricopeptide (TPR) repeat protein
MRAMALQGLGALEEAVQAYGRALQLSPRWADLRARRAETLSQLGEWQHACADADAALEIDPRCERALQTRGIARYALGDREGSRADLAEHLRLTDPANAAARLEELLRLLRDKFGP